MWNGILYIYFDMNKLLKSERINPYVKDIYFIENSDKKAFTQLPFYADGFPGIVFSESQEPFSLQPKNKIVSNVLNGIMIVVGLIYASISTYYTISNNLDFFSLTTLWTFLFPLILTIIFLPFLYFLTLYRKYESFFVRLKYIAKTDDNVLRLKKEVKKVANVSISKITNLSKNIDRYELLNSTDWNKYLKEISRIKNDN